MNKSMTSMTNIYEVHTWSLCEGWVNCWIVTDEKGNDQPDSYPSIEAAQAEIDEIFEEIEYQVKSGERLPDEGFDRDDYRIYDKENSKYVA